MDRPSAFILYRPAQRPAQGQVTANPAAWGILSPPAEAAGDGTVTAPAFHALCATWAARLDARPESAGGPGKVERQDSGQIIDVYQSRRRQYAVRGLLLSAGPSSPHQTPRPPAAQYLFVLERIVPETADLSVIIARQWRLNRREQEIVHLLLTDRSNKEIADGLGLSLNTVKGYLKILMRKLGASSRTGIVARILTAKEPVS